MIPTQLSPSLTLFLSLIRKCDHFRASTLAAGKASNGIERIFACWCLAIVRIRTSTIAIREEASLNFSLSSERKAKETLAVGDKLRST